MVDADSGPSRSARLQRLRTCTLQDLVAIYLPYMLGLTTVVVVACFLYDPDMKFLLYSAIRSKSDHSWWDWIIFVICSIEEARFIMFVMGIVLPMLQLQIISFDSINDIIQNLMECTTGDNER